MMPRMKNASNSPVANGFSLSEQEHLAKGNVPRRVGSRFGTIKSSGLLADDRKAPQPHASADGYVFMTSDLKDGISTEATGRDIYTFQKITREKSASGREGLVRSVKVSFKQDKETSSGDCCQKKPLHAAQKSAPVLRRKKHVHAAQKSAPVLRRKKHVHYMESSASDEETPLSEAAKNTSEPSSDNDDNSEKQKYGVDSASKRVLTRKCPTKRTPRVNKEMADDYFSAHHGKAGKTSDRTLSQLDTSPLDQVAVKEILDLVPLQFKSDMDHLSSEAESLFPYWLFQLSSGFNILLYGLGSKRKVVEDFCTTSLSDSCHIIVNGFFPGFAIKHLLMSLSCDLLQHSGSFKSYVDHCHFICRALCNRKNTPSEVFLIVHNIDGATLRVEKAQTALSLLSLCPHIHILASIDHINAPLIWDQTMLSRFSWVWHDVTLYKPYQIETSYENSLVKQSSSLALSSMIQVIKSLTPNARGIFRLLSYWQIEHHGDPSYLGLTLTELYSKSREKFLVNSEATLKTHLTEFLDHKLIRWKKAGDGAEYLVIAADHSILTHFLEHELDE